MNRLIVAAALTLAAGQAAAEVRVEVGLAAPDALQVNYALPASCSGLSFLKHGPWAGQIRARWQPLENCGIAGGDQLVRGTASCQVLSFRVPATSDKVAGYPGSFPTGEAIYAHMSNYAVGAECGPVQYSFSAPGSIATRFKLHQGRAAVDADAPALLFPKPRARGKHGLDYFDPARDAATVAQIRQRADGTEAALRKAMPHARYKRPIIAATLAREPGGPNIGGNAGDILHLSLFNWPEVASEEDALRLDVLVTHEMAHRFQMRDAVDGYPDARLIHEGGGEFLRWMVALRAGWLTPAQAGRQLDDALATCLVVAGERAWRDLKPGEIGANRLEYACGLPAYVYALAARQGKGTAIGRIDDFYRQLRAGRKPGFAQAMECGAAPCTPSVLPAILEQQAPLREQWAAVLQATGLARPGVPGQSQLDAMLYRALTRLVQDDCGGKSSMTPAMSQGRLLVDAMAGCQAVRNDIEVLQVEGQPVFGSPHAMPALLQACSARQSIELGLKDGTALALPCRRQLTMTQVYAADMDKLARALGLAHAR
ncbi:hypothetical protein [Pseudoduganella sp.]|uniref:hypothetical protein n=1 Tax=Pseudoduganella sp. TaxID=1880898 RepID=UPI0035B3F9C3